MEQNNVVIKGQTESTQQIAGAIIIAGLIIAAAILYKSNNAQQPIAVNNNGNQPSVGNVNLAPITGEDRALGNKNAKVSVVLYEDFQCPFCDKLFKEVEKPIIDSYVKNGKVQIVYRDFAFLGQESIKAAEAARCAGDQGKFWEYHDYLFSHQNGENKGGFADANLKNFAGILGLDQASFDQCLTSSKYAKAVNDSTSAGKTAGVQGTPKGFILRNGKVVSTIDGAEPLTNVTPKIDAALK